MKPAFLVAAALFSLGAFAADPSPDAASRHADFIQQVQEKLNALGFDAGNARADSGGKTQAALAQFQRSRDLPASGQLDARTLLELEIDAPLSDNASVGAPAAQENAEKAKPSSGG